MRLLFILFFFLLSGTIFSQGIFEQGNEIEGESKEESKFEFNGYVRASSFIGFDEFDFSNLFAEAAFQSKLHHDKAYLYSDIRVREAYLYNKSETRFQIKELFAAYTGTRFDAFLGNQIVEWGRGDGFNPTNCITPTNYFFLSGNVDDQKMSNFLLRFKYRFTDQIELDLITIPIYRASIYRYDLFDLGKMTQFSDMVLPGKSFDNMAFAARLNFEMSKAAFSFSWFRGFNPDYGFNLQNVDWSTSMPDISYAPTPYFKNLIGFDLALPLASWIFRSEIAYSQSKDYEEFMYVPNPDLSYVLGLEKSYKGFTSIFQYVGKYTMDYTDLQLPLLTDPDNPMAQWKYANDLIFYESALFNRRQFYQQKEMNHALALTISKSFNYDTWKTELTGYYNFTSEEYLIRPKVKWIISDAISTSAGCSFMAGPEGRIFDYAGPILNGAFVDLSVSF